jgi:hypothetical protein
MEMLDLIDNASWIEDIISNWQGRVHKFQITSTKLQINFNIQKPMAKTTTLVDSYCHNNHTQQRYYT